MDTKLEPLAETRWSAKAARHLLNRAGFGVPEGRVKSLYEQGLAGAVRDLVDYEHIPFPSGQPEFVIAPMSRETRRDAMRGLSEDARRRKTAEWRQAERRAIQQLKGWWLERMATTPRPLEEKMALFWHGHFATSAQKVQSSWHTHDLNGIFRKHATGNFKALTVAVGQSPTMLRYLDNAQSTKQKPNENWARELMELFTMGAGTYSEEDIKNSARAFTGWSANHEGFQYRRQVHDAGQKRFLGREGAFDGLDIINIIFEQPATAAFICRKLWAFFAYEDAEPEIIAALAQTLRAHQYELKPVLRQVFESQAFYSDRALGRQIKSPAQFVVQLAHDLNLEPIPFPLMARAAAQLGQDLFYPPNVKGWDGGRAWINANSLLIRYNLPIALALNPADAGENMADAMMMTGLPPARGAGGEQMRVRVQEALEKLPEAERRALRRRLQQASPEERRVLARQVLNDAGTAGGWSARRMVAGLPGDSGTVFVHALVERFMSAPMRPDQEAMLLEALGLDRDGPVHIEGISNDRLHAALHLLLSCAEYQLC
jgi:uncharacterized protein (DUF1800 family)